ncbi:syntaxin-binding protein 5-like isoform X1 [Zophobas morio]|uniref:syntaxin-binding protein 5-like isoform X1 n=1 Tax=Zophobas morio TaxID=2755281 RepID=UPI003083B585
MLNKSSVGKSKIIKAVPLSTVKEDTFAFVVKTRHQFETCALSLAYNSSQKLLAVGFKTGKILILGDVGVEVTLVLPKTSPVWLLKFAVGKPYLLASDKKVVYIFSIDSQEPEIVGSLTTLREEISTIHAPVNSSWIYLGTQKGNVHLLKVELCALSSRVIHWDKLVACTKEHPGPVVVVEENPVDLTKLLVAHSCNISLYSTKKNKLLGCFGSSYIKPVTSLSWYHDGTKFYSAHNIGLRVLWSSTRFDFPVSFNPYYKGKEEMVTDDLQIETINKITCVGDCVVFDGGQQSVSGKYSINVNENSLLLDERVVDFVAFSDRNSKDAIYAEHLVVLHETSLAFYTVEEKNFSKQAHPYSFRISENTDQLTCVRYYMCTDRNFFSCIKSLGSIHKSKQKKSFIMSGGKKGKKTSARDFIVAGYADGKIDFWSGERVVLAHLATFDLRSYVSGISPSLGSPLELDCYHICALELCIQSRELVVQFKNRCLFVFTFSETPADAALNLLSFSVGASEGREGRTLRTSSLLRRSKSESKKAQEVAQSLTAVSSCGLGKVMLGGGAELEKTTSAGNSLPKKKRFSKLIKKLSIAPKKESLPLDEDAPALAEPVSEQPRVRAETFSYCSPAGFRLSTILLFRGPPDPSESNSCFAVNTLLKSIATATGGDLFIVDYGNGAVSFSGSISDSGLFEEKDRDKIARDTISSIKFTYGQLNGSDTFLSPQLIIGTTSGALLFYSLLLLVPPTLVQYKYMIEEKIVNVEVTNHAGVIVMCPCGTWSSSVREALEEDSKELLQEDAAVTVTEKYFCEEFCYQLLVVTSEKAVVVCSADLKTLVATKGLANGLIFRSRCAYLAGCTCVVAVDNLGDIFVLTFPHLECIYSFPTSVPHDLLGFLCISQQDGRVVYVSKERAFERASLVIGENRLELPKSLPVAYNADIAPPEKHSGGILGSFFKENDEAKRNELFKLPEEPPVLERLAKKTEHRKAPIMRTPQAHAEGLAATLGNTFQALAERGDKLGSMDEQSSQMKHKAASMLENVREYNRRKAARKWYQL